MEAICFFLGKELDMADSSMDTWKTEWIKHMNSRRLKINDNIPDWTMIS